MDLTCMKPIKYDSKKVNFKYYEKKFKLILVNVDYEIIKKN